MADSTIMQGDLVPVISGTLLGPNKQPAPVVSGTTARFKMVREFGATLAIDQPAVVTTGSPAISYAWQPGDTAAHGMFDAWFEVLTPGAASPQTFPNGRTLKVQITRKPGL